MNMVSALARMIAASEVKHMKQNIVKHGATVKVVLSQTVVSNPEWRDLVKSNCIELIEKRLRCTFQKTAAALLAHLKFRSLYACIKSWCKLTFSIGYILVSTVVLY
ncbi:hypothetical protein ABBQ38_000736 [Trebouxia sp. C0009 RCD-2024]